MIRAILMFLIVWGCAAIAMTYVRNATGKQLLSMFETVAYSLVTAVVALMILIWIVIAF